MKSHILVLLCSSVLVACGGRNPGEGPIREDKFINLYADMLILKEEVNLSRADSSQLAKGLDSLFSIYHVTSSQVETSVRNYREDLQRWKKLYEDVSKRLDSLRLGQVQAP